MAAMTTRPCVSSCITVASFIGLRQYIDFLKPLRADRCWVDDPFCWSKWFDTTVEASRLCICRAFKLRYQDSQVPFRGKSINCHHS